MVAILTAEGSELSIIDEMYGAIAVAGMPFSIALIAFVAFKATFTSGEVSTKLVRLLIKAAGFLIDSPALTTWLAVFKLVPSDGLAIPCCGVLTALVPSE